MTFLNLKTKHKVFCRFNTLTRFCYKCSKYQIEKLQNIVNYTIIYKYKPSLCCRKGVNIDTQLIGGRGLGKGNAKDFRQTNTWQYLNSSSSET